MSNNGLGKMPRDWPGFITWALSPFRVFLFVLNFIMLFGAIWAGTILYSIGIDWFLSVLIPTIIGLGFLWLIERARE